MTIELIHNNVFAGKEQAILLTVDGLASGMEGNIARAFERKYPECWEELNLDIQYPIPLGQSRLYEIDDGLAEDENCPYRYAVIASTLHHLENLNNQERQQIISRALKSALSLTAQKGIGTLATTILTGGWRLPETDALITMLKTYQDFRQINPQLPKLNIYIMEEQKYLSAVEEYTHWKNNL